MAGGVVARAEARVDLARLEANYRAVAAFAGRPVMPVVKADAYGHGAVRVAQVFESLGSPLLAVALPEEGLALRRGGISIPVVVLAGCWPGEEELFRGHRLTPVVCSESTLEGALLLARSGPLAVHLKMDTGMTRLGFLPSEVGAVAARLAAEGVAIEGFMSHLTSPDEDAQVTSEQLDRFDEALEDLVRQGHRPRWTHVANSAGLGFLRPTQTLVRPGLLLYGIRPRPLCPPIEVRPAMTLAARIVQVKDVAGGTGVSYGGRWAARRPSRIATVALGYADGVPRTDAMSARGRIAIGGRTAPVVGTVCMDFFMADVTEIEGVAPGAEAVLFGDAPTAWDVAACAGTNAWQALTAIGPRVPRVYTGTDGRGTRATEK